MKLGSETNSVVNHLLSRGTIGQPEPEVGMGVTFLGWTDREPGTIAVVFADGNGRAVRFLARRDKAKRVDGGVMSECQSYEFERDPDGVQRVYQRDRNGLWRAVRLNENGRYVFVDKSQSIKLGERDKYYDFSF